MANIPVERTSRGGGTPWWVWLLGLIVLIALIWLLAALLTNDDPADPAVRDDPTMVDPAPPPTDDTQVLTDPQVLTQAPDPRLYEGRQVRLQNMRVEVAYSDSLFYAVPAEDPVERRFFVVVGDPATPRIGEPATIQEGEQVTVHGRIQEPTRNELDRWNITENERDRLMRLEDYYIRADRVQR